ncbi:MAG: hypothetical protein LBV54_04690 [Puniceicoccales bacterium]|jgi:hypothetical protein|nr:hypothetical protein [Puniceicoccales bacterium]
MKHISSIVSLFIIGTAFVWQGCANEPERTAQTNAGQQQADDDYNIAEDPVLGWWRFDGDSEDDTKASMLWPTESADTHALRTIRFLNDGMATNGCCAGAEWNPAAPKFYKVERGISELYYMPDAATLYFLDRTDTEASAADFQKIIVALGKGDSPESLQKKGLLPAFAKYRRIPVSIPGRKS